MRDLLPFTQKMNESDLQMNQNQVTQVVESDESPKKMLGFHHVHPEKKKHPLQVEKKLGGPWNVQHQKQTSPWKIFFKDTWKSLNWWVYRISEPSTVVGQVPIHVPSDCCTRARCGSRAFWWSSWGLVKRFCSKKVEAWKLMDVFFDMPGDIGTIVLIEKKGKWFILRYFK